MTQPRVFGRRDGDRVVVEGEDLRHIRKVLRLRKGDRLTVCDGTGQECEAVLERITGESACGRIVRVEENMCEPSLRIDLYQALPKFRKMDIIIQKAVELGVQRIVPFTTRRTVKRLDETKKDKNLARWQRIAHEAAKQSRRAVVPVVSPVMDLSRVVKGLGEYELAVVPWEGSRTPAKEVFSSCPEGLKRAAVVIGPEGGFDKGEVEELTGGGARAVSLGPRILRVETAALAALTVLLFSFGEMDGP